MKSAKQSSQQHERVYIVCLNPQCLSDKQRCLTTRTLHDHPKECSKYYYPADEITNKHWAELEKYPIDSLGQAAKRKASLTKTEHGSNYLLAAVARLREKLQASLKELETKLLELYPENQFTRCYENVYGLEKVAEGLRMKMNSSYISSLISQNFSAQNYHILLRLNENYDDVRNSIEGLNNKLMSNFQTLLGKHRSYQLMPTGKKATFKKYNYGVYKSKFVASLKIEFDKSKVYFPKLQAISSFLPWIYTDQYFTSGTHQFKINSLRYPIVQNAGFTVLEEQDIDTYPYTHFKSLFSRDGKGFKLVSGEEIDQFVAETTIVTLRLELGAQPKAVIHDSQRQCVYECELVEKRAYRMGVYGCGWAMDVIQLS